MTALELSQPSLTDLSAECRTCGWTLDLNDAAAATIMDATRWHARTTGHRVGYSRTVIREYRRREPSHESP